MIEIQYRYQVEDFEEFVSALKKRNPRPGRRKKAYLLIGVAVLLLPFLAAGSFLHPDPSLFWALPFGAYLVCAGWPLSKTRARKRLSKLIYDHPYTATIDGSGIITRSPTVKTELHWAAFTGYYRTENLFSSYLSIGDVSVPTPGIFS